MSDIKKTCERCKALILDNSTGGGCRLGYKQENYKPLEECPKPLNNTEYLHCSPVPTEKVMGKN